MKTPVKRSEAAPIIHVHDVGPYVNEPVPGRARQRLAQKLQRKKAITTNVLSNYNKGLIVQKN
jgi:hypothetical protein